MLTIRSKVENLTSVLDPLWKFGFRFVPEGVLKVHQLSKEYKRLPLTKIDGLKDWRNIVRKHIDNLPPIEKDWPRAASDKY